MSIFTNKIEFLFPTLLGRFVNLEVQRENSMEDLGGWEAVCRSNLVMEMLHYRENDPPLATVMKGRANELEYIL